MATASPVVTKERAMARLPSIRLDHCVIASSDFARSDAFYAAVFGASVSRPYLQQHVYVIAGQALSVHGPGAARLAGPAMLAATPVIPGNSDLCFEWEGPIEDAVAHLRDCGVSVETGPVDRNGARGAGVSIYFRDPDGSLLEFISYVPPRQPQQSVAVSDAESPGPPSSERHADLPDVRSLHLILERLPQL